MLDRDMELTGKQPQKTAQKPGAGEARVERQCTVDQRDHSADIFAEASQHKRGVCEEARVVLSDVKGLSGLFDSSAADFLVFLDPAVIDKP